MNPAQLSAPIARDKARIVVTRDTSLLYIAAAASIKANGLNIASLGRGGSVVYDVPKGEAVLEASTPFSFGRYVMKFDAKAQETYKFKVSPKGSTFFVVASFGMLGEAVNASVSEQSGYFKLELQP